MTSLYHENKFNRIVDGHIRFNMDVRVQVENRFDWISESVNVHVREVPVRPLLIFLTNNPQNGLDYIDDVRFVVPGVGEGPWSWFSQQIFKDANLNFDIKLHLKNMTLTEFKTLSTYYQGVVYFGFQIMFEQLKPEVRNLHEEIQYVLSIPVSPETRRVSPETRSFTNMGITSMELSL